MQAFLAFLGAIFLIICIWFLVDYPSFNKATGTAHRAILQRIFQSEADLPQQTIIDGNKYILIPLHGQ